MTHEERHEFLLRAAISVRNAFMNGNHPTFQQMEKLNSAIMACTEMLICGHRVTEDCDCEILNALSTAAQRRKS